MLSIIENIKTKYNKNIFVIKQTTKDKIVLIEDSVSQIK